MAVLLAPGGETEDAAKHSTLHRAAPTTKNSPGPSVSSAQAEKPQLHQFVN